MDKKTEKMKKDFLQIMNKDYLLDAVEVEDWFDNYAKNGLAKDETAQSMADSYANKYHLIKRNESSFGF